MKLTQYTPCINSQTELNSLRWLTTNAGEALLIDPQAKLYTVCQRWPTTDHRNGWGTYLIETQDLICPRCPTIDRRRWEGTPDIEVQVVLYKRVTVDHRRRQSFCKKELLKSAAADHRKWWHSCYGPSHDTILTRSTTEEKVRDRSLEFEGEL